MPPRTASTPTPSPDVEMVRAWRLLMTVVANSLGVGVGLVTRDTGLGTLELMAPSVEPAPPFEPGDLLAIEPGLLCGQVMSREAELAVADARTEAQWANNATSGLGLIAYLGYPVYWPDGQVFGSICVLNHEPRDFNEVERSMLLSARDAIHDSLLGAGVSPSYPAVGDSDPLGLWDLDPDTETLRMSASMREQYSFAPDGPPTTLTQWLRSLPQAADVGFGERMAALLAGHLQNISFATTMWTETGPSLIRIAARAIRASDETVRHVVGLHWSRPIHLPAASAAATSELRLVVDARQRVVELTEAMADLLGTPADAPPARVDDACAGMAESAQFRRTLGETIASGAQRVTVLQRRWSEQPLMLVVTPLTLPGGVPGAVVTPLPPSALGKQPPRDPFFTRDPVTGLHTRRHTEAQLGRLLARHRRPGTNSRVLLSVVEVRNLDRIVRADGHDAADATLIRVAERLRGPDRFVGSLGLGYFVVLRLSRDSAPQQQRQLTDETAELRAVQSVAPSLSVQTLDVSGQSSRAPEEILADALRGVGAAAVQPAEQRLTGRQMQIASLVPEGLSNREIAERLVITPRTVEGHLDIIRTKFGVRNRSQITAKVLRHPELVTAAD